MKYIESLYAFFSREQFIESFSSGLFATFLGGSLLALFLFWVREKIVPRPEINGRWFFQIKTVNSAYNPYKDMTLTYVVMMGHEGGRIYGTTEKIYENSVNKNGPFVGEERVRGEIRGYIEKKYFGKDRVNLHIVEKGRKRDSTQFHTLKVKKKYIHRDETNALNLKFRKEYLMSGDFTSTVSDQDGNSKWQRHKF
ncbi:MAG: hypothetical protein JJT87_19545 [Halomonas sp.]|nr:hypothetical protein [Halomonas sp.]MCC5904112.1 hypothetical protein [Halomonas sp.]